MNNRTGIKSLVSGMALAVLLGVASLSTALAADLSDPAVVVDEYLASIVKGDVQGILARIDGRMISKNKALELSPDSYSQFLQTHYAGVQTVVENITPQNDKMLARVRFDYPSSDSSIIEFILAQSNGQWKIVGENY